MSKKQNAIICIAANNSQIPIITASLEMGYAVVAIDRDATAKGFKYVNERIIISTLEVQYILNRLRSLQDKYNFAGVICRSSGVVLYTAVAIAEEFNLPGLTKEITTLATQKSQLREFCLDNDIRMVRGTRVIPGEINNLRIPFPVIVKPDLPIVGKKNITVIWEKDTLADAIDIASSISGNKAVEIEEYIEGIDVSILFHMSRGKSKVITYWDELNGLNIDNTIAGIGISVPSVISDTIIQQKLDLVTSRLAFSFRDVQSLMILSVRIDNKGDIFVIELHADLGGDLIADILLPSASLSFDFFKIAVSASSGNEIGTRPLIFAPTAILFTSKNVNIEKTMQVKKIKGQYILNSDTINDLHCKVTTAWRRSEYIKLPSHKEWLNMWRKN